MIEDDADPGATSFKSRYLHTDHLGSITTIVDSAGVQNLSYDVFGKRRDATTWMGAAVIPSTEKEVHGYTGHEHLDDVSLIHMNGRIYDPVLGRMASADPILQSPFNAQNYNRYSYVLNNPLKYTDPSGFKGESQLPPWACLEIHLCIATNVARWIGDRLPGLHEGWTGPATANTGAPWDFGGGLWSSVEVGEQSAVDLAERANQYSLYIAVSAACAADWSCYSSATGNYSTRSGTPAGEYDGAATAVGGDAARIIDPTVDVQGRVVQDSYWSVLGGRFMSGQARDDMITYAGSYAESLSFNLIDTGVDESSSAYTSGQVASIFAGGAGLVKGGIRGLRAGWTAFKAGRALRALRGQYVSAVEALATRVPGMRQAGMSSEQIARALHAERRVLGEQFKALTPADKLAEIMQRNMQRYGDPLGPSIDWLRAQGKTWEQIIESASRAGGRDLGF